MCVRERDYVRLCVRERERERERDYVRVCVREIEIMLEYVLERERLC